MSILYICGTPIGNLDDISFRVIDTLKNVDLIAAEDTRHSRKLLTHFDIKTNIISYHEHNKKGMGIKLLNKLEDGADVAIITDAGMPGISDPGQELIMLCHENNIPVTVIPGPTAVTSAMALSGLPNGKFIFDGFLPNSSKERKEQLLEYANQTRHVVLYEAPHHIVKTLNDINNVLGNRKVVLLREITKKFEEVLHIDVIDAIAMFETDNPRGEYVLIIVGIDKEIVKEEIIKKWEEITIQEHMKIYMDKDINEKDAMKLVAKDRGVSKREIYSELKTN